MSVFDKCVLVLIITSGVNCGLLTGDFKLKSRPLTINSHRSPIHISINSDKLKAPLPPLSLPKPAKPPPKLKDLFKQSFFSEPLPTLSTPKLTKLPKLPSLSKSFLSPKLSPLSKLSAPLLPPIIPPLLPLLPLPLLPPLIPPLPLLPIIPPPLFPAIPVLSPFANPLRPIKVPLLGAKTPLQKALGSELNPIAVAVADGKKDLILRKLRKLLTKGSLTTDEFNRFRRLLLG